MGDNVFRRYLLSQYRKRYHIFAAAETWCPGPEKEKEWAKDWKGSGGVVWASGPPETADNLHGHARLPTPNSACMARGKEFETAVFFLMTFFFFSVFYMLVFHFSRMFVFE